MSQLTDVARATISPSLGQPSNEEMQQTKPAFFLDCAGFAADLRC